MVRDICVILGENSPRGQTLAEEVSSENAQRPNGAKSIGFVCVWR